MLISRKDIWIADLDPVSGHEQGRVRPVLILSADQFNATQAGMVVVLPITTRDRGFRIHIPIVPPEGGLNQKSFIMTEQIRSISTGRLQKRIGTLSQPTMKQIEECITFLLDID